MDVFIPFLLARSGWFVLNNLQTVDKWSPAVDSPPGLALAG